MVNEVQSLKLTCFAEKNLLLCQSMISFCFVNTEEKVHCSIHAIVLIAAHPGLFSGFWAVLAK